VIEDVTGPPIADGARSATLRVPAETDALGLVRLFAASIGRHLDVPSEGIEDLKLALTEVCSAAIEASRPGDGLVAITVSWPSEPDALMVHVSASSSFSIGDPARDDRARLLSALRLEVRPTDDGRGAGFAVSTTSP
jgi:anti-sigma regulatory factor (Ser/Thr protein kinase)